MQSKKLIFLAVFFLFSCAAREERQRTDSKLTTVSNLSLSAYSKEGKNWDIKCLRAQIDEEKKIIACEKPFIVAISEGKATSQIKGETGIVELDKDKAFIKDNVQVKSLREKLLLYSSKIYFDSSKNMIWSDSKVRVLTDKTETSALGFSAKPDLSKINFYNHETKKI